VVGRKADLEVHRTAGPAAAIDAADVHRDPLDGQGRPNHHDGGKHDQQAQGLTNAEYPRFWI
jgi:hypothetical protein